MRETPPDKTGNRLKQKGYHSCGGDLGCDDDDQNDYDDMMSTMKVMMMMMTLEI